MLEKGKITPLQAGLLMIFAVTATANFNLPAVASKDAKIDAWMTPIIATFPALLLAWIMAKCGKMFPERNMSEYLQVILGRYLGRVVLLGYLLWLLWTNILIIRTVVDFIVTAFMPETPIEAFIIMMMILTAWGVKLGLEVLGRMATFVFPLFAGSFMLILILTVPDMDFSALTPILAEGIKPVFKGSILPFGWRGETILMAFIWPFLNKPENGLKATAAAVIYMGLFLTITTAGVSAVFGPLTPNFRFPVFELARYVSVGQFIERLDPLIMAIWIAGAFIKIGIFYYVICLIAAQLFQLKSYQPVVYPLGIILGLQSLVAFPNVTIFVNSLMVWPYFAYNFEYFIPLGILLVAYFRGFHKKRRLPLRRNGGSIKDA